MIKLSKDNLQILNQLELPKNEATLPGYLQGFISGASWVNDIINPTTAILVIADFCYLIGNIDKKYKAEIVDILKDNCKGKLIGYSSNTWSEFIEENFAETFKKRKRYSFKHESNIFDRNKLENYADAIQPELNTKRINEEIYQIALQQSWTEDFCSNFLSLEHFLNYGIGYVIMKDGEIISGASSYSYCKGHIDITIETKPEYQRKGLALACASKVILECLDRNIYPKWDASNLNSVALAEKLGYNLDKEYFIYFI
ncbi:GNAT family N-acetyltransferase [Alloiococcus sp. CFN-8]|uniref:GNAT family N-acetyltransferase n=1 Tax=Alloiococcus sp. CFN-8 TaxID=3416081 RepID=UPI003CEB7DF7